MSVIYLIRHGQASFGNENYDQLSELGHEQSTKLGLALSQRLVLFDKVYTGSMLRHEQTANNCLAKFGGSSDGLLNESNPTVDSGWNEYDHPNILANYHPEFASHDRMVAFLKKQDKPKQAFEYHFNQAIDRWIQNENNIYSESWNAFCARVHASFKQVLDESSTFKSVAVFTSGGPISLIAQSLLGAAPEKIMTMNWTLLNCGVTKLVSTSDRVFVSTLNEHSHFNEKRLLTYT